MASLFVLVISFLLLQGVGLLGIERLSSWPRCFLPTCTLHSARFHFVERLPLRYGSER